MIRLLFVLIALAAIASGFAWIADRPGDVVLTVGRIQFETSLVVALCALAAAFLAVWLVIAALRLIFSAPGQFSAAGRRRNRERGRQALARGMIAAAAGDARGAQKAGLEASRRLRDDPMALLLEAQNAQLAEDRDAAGRAFRKMSERSDMRLLGLRGLHAEAVRRGDVEGADEFAKRASAIAPLPWAARAILERLTATHDWTGALKALDSQPVRKALDRSAADRQRAVLSTAAALDLRERDPDQALALARDALKLAPDLTPAAAVAAEILTRRQDIRKAARLLESAWKLAPHPDLARAYLAVRPGDSAGDRLSRAKALTRMHRDHPESRMILARAAIEARAFLDARRALAPLIDAGRPTRRMCLLMADLEETEHGADAGPVREWLARATRAPRDPAWVADGFVSDVWAPVSPVTGRLDAFVWKTPDERLSAIEPPAPPVLPAAQITAAPDDPHEIVVAPPRESPNERENDVVELPAESLAEAPVAAPPASAAATARPVFFPHPQAPDDPGAATAAPVDAAED